MHKILLPIAVIFCLMTGCKNDQASIDDRIIKQYISDHHLTAIAEPNGLYYVETVVGTGGHPTASSTDTVIYKGYLTDGTIFDQNLSGTFSISLNNAIAGWQQGIPLMQKGGRATLLIPSALGYGNNYVSSSIPPNSVLLFDVQLIGFYQ